MRNLRVVGLLFLLLVATRDATECRADALAEQSGFGLAVRLSSSASGFDLLFQPESPDFAISEQEVMIQTLDDPSRLVVVLPYRSSIEPKAVPIDHPFLTKLRFGLHPDKLRVVVDAKGPVIFQLGVPETSDGGLIIRFAPLKPDPAPTRKENSAQAEPSGIPQSPVFSAKRLDAPMRSIPVERKAVPRVLTIPMAQNSEPVLAPAAPPPPAEPLPSKVLAYTVKDEVVERVSVDRKPSVSRIYWGVSAAPSASYAPPPRAVEHVVAPDVVAKNPNPLMPFVEDDSTAAQERVSAEEEAIFEESAPVLDIRSNMERSFPFIAMAVAALVIAVRYLPLGFVKRRVRRAQDGYRRRQKRSRAEDLSMYYQILALREDATERELDERFREFVEQREASLASGVKTTKVSNPLDLQFSIIGQAYRTLKKARYGHEAASSEAKKFKQ